MVKRVWLLVLEEIKKPRLFTTEDGVDIFKGDNYYFINAEWEVRFTGDNYNWIGDNLKAFSSKVKTQEYILMNKPLFSVNDIFKIGDVQNKFFQDRFIEKAKEKINKP